MKVLVWMLVLVLVVVGVVSSEGVDAPPNVLVLLADDLGIGDLGCYGNTTINTPNIDRLASEGVRLTHHLSAAAYCTPSRAALLTSRFPTRYGMDANRVLQIPVILHTTSNAALPKDEVTIAEAFQAANYTTALVGKWHLGMECSFLGKSCLGPSNHGFHSFFGIPTTLFFEFGEPGSFWVFPLWKMMNRALIATWLIIMCSLMFGYYKKILKASHIMAILLISHFLFIFLWFTFNHCNFTSGASTLSWAAYVLLLPFRLLDGNPARPPSTSSVRVSEWFRTNYNSFLFRDNKLVEKPIQLEGLTQKLVQESTQFLTSRAKDNRPFFLMHSFTHVHTPMFSARHWKGRSRHGRYGDNVEELDEGVGAILDTLRELGLEKNTLVYFTSDHGGHLEAVEPGTMERIGGHNGRFKGGKGQGGSEGGIRVPGLYRWPGILPTGVTVDVPTSLMDLMPTVLSLTGLPNITQLVPRSADKELDGVDISRLLTEYNVVEERGKNEHTGKDQHPTRRIFLHHCQEDVHAMRLYTGEHVYKMYLYRHQWHKGSTQCGWGPMNYCPCFTQIYNLTTQPMLYDLIQDPYEDYPPITHNTSEYKAVTRELLAYLQQWRDRVYFPPSQISSWGNFMWRFWVQP
ncbi:hypothetical protein Pmani_028019 [Petrolisthes manimaculis]|uniref:Sulfatase N-terminal domain-containing protein n=1 Tax=Petrolisthes manimaculis TaxID=1843537 RepID=A0AAE1TYG5_9EUCA|nr:hypothetical protein Pmani_028019 [Petrolisthes manimaculis]